MDRPQILPQGSTVIWIMGGQRTTYRLGSHMAAIAKAAELEQEWDDRVAGERALEQRYLEDGVDVVRSWQPAQPAVAPAPVEIPVMTVDEFFDTGMPGPAEIVATETVAGFTEGIADPVEVVVDPGLIAQPASQPKPRTPPPPQRPYDRDPAPTVEPATPQSASGAPPLKPVSASITYDPVKGKAVIELAPNRDVTLWRSVAGTKSSFDLKAADGAKTRNWGAKPGDTVTIRVDDKDGLLILEHQIPEED